MASGPITSWQKEGEKVEAVTNFLFLVSKITRDDDYSHEIRRQLLGRKAMTNLDSMLKSKDITLPTKVHTGKAMVFPVVTYGCKSWAIKTAESQRIDAFKLCCWKRLLRVPWKARKSNQSILKEINPEYSLEGLMLKQKLQNFGHLMRTANSLEKTLMPRKTEDRRGWQEDEMVGWDHRFNGHELGQTLGDGEGQGSLVCCMQCMGSQRVRNNLATEQEQVYKFSQLSNPATNAYATSSLNCSISNWINTTGTVREEKKYFLKRVCERDWVLRNLNASERDKTKTKAIKDK